MLNLPLVPLSTDLEQEKPARVADTEKICTFDIDYLDKTLLGIIPSDLVAVGAKSGIGKTEIAIHIARGNALAGRRVAFLALEAEKHEVARRLKYRELSRLYYDDRHTRHWKSDLSYRLFRFNRLDPKFEQYEIQAEQALKSQLQNLSVYYREESFDIETLSQFLSSVKRDIDLLVIDHLHYFETYDQNEHKEFSSIMKKLRKLNLIYGIPIIIVAHLRKNGIGLIPDLDDFMGTSDIGKIVTTAIMISPDYDDQDYQKGVHGTYIRVVKSRMGNVSRLVASIQFNSFQAKYNSMTKLLQLSKTGDKLTTLKEYDYPPWLRKRPEEDIPF